jgi:hypothetical protein
MASRIKQQSSVQLRSEIETQLGWKSWSSMWRSLPLQQLLEVDFRIELQARIKDKLG